MARTPEQLRNIANGEKCLGDYVPFAAEIAPGVVKLKGGNGYLSIFEIEGVPVKSGEFGSELSNSGDHDGLQPHATAHTGTATSIWRGRYFSSLLTQ